MKIVLLALGLSAVGCVLLVSCGNESATDTPCSEAMSLLGECQSSSSVASGTTCETVEDCPKPAVGQCVESQCVDLKCQITSYRGPISQQVYGDCQKLECDLDGNIVSVSDSSDVYDDGRECTLDICQEGKPVNILLNKGFPCPTSGEGVCNQGECVECVDGVGPICGPGMICDNLRCAPADPCLDKFCGGPCQLCAIGYQCEIDTDCMSGKCVGGKCQAPTCDDGLKNGDEEDVDCGGPTCGPCADDKGCVWPSDCQSDVCIAGKCQAPTCFDGKKNGSETAPDCGGPCGPC